MRHRDRATANGRIHPRDPGQLAVRAAHDQPLIIGHTRSGRRRRVDDDLGGLTEKFELRVEPAQLRPRHEHKRSRLPQRVQLVDEQAGSKPPAAQPLDVPVHPRRRQFAVSFLALRDLMRALSAHRDGASINAAAKASGINYRTAQRIVEAAAVRRQRQLVAVG
jgi:hypothetical protein